MSDDLAEIPATELEFGLWLINLRQDAQSDPNLSSEKRTSILRQFDTLSRMIVKLGNLRAAGLLQTEADAALQAIAEGLHATIQIGAYFPDALRTAPTRAANKKRMRTAHSGRRRQDIREIIERHARRLWDRKKSFIGNAEGTAKEIYEAATDEIAKLPKVPKQWRLTKPQAEVDKEKAIETIAARIRGFMRV
jgi:hypothetical protein